MWTCTSCGKRYPQLHGVAFLSVIDADWITTLGEIIARRRIVQRLADSIGLEVGRKERHEQQVETCGVVMGSLFEEVLNELDIKPGMRILDVGAGICPTSAEFARRGAEVVAAESEMGNLLYVSFEQTDPEEPERYETAQHVFYSKNPVKYPSYFNRVVAPAHRLPFESSTFDVVFCRSVLHHLHDLPRAMHEMLRVLKPGGKLVACSEPTRSILDREDHYLVGTVDKEEGLNEQVPTLVDYWRGLYGYTHSPSVQVWPNAHRFESKKLFDWVPYNFHRHVWPGEKVSGWKLAKLLPFSTSANMQAVRNLARIAKPPVASDSLKEFDITLLAAISAPRSVEESLRTYREDTRMVCEGWRQLMARYQRHAAAFAPAVNAERDLRIGWRRKLRRAGVAFRFTNRFAEVILGRPAGSKVLEMRVRAPEPLDEEAAGKGVSGSVLVNGAQVGSFSDVGSQWTQLAWPLPEGDFPVAEVELVHEQLVLSLEEGERAELGLAVHWIRLS